jgi:hypothetical protein
LNLLIYYLRFFNLNLLLLSFFLLKFKVWWIIFFKEISLSPDIHIHF